MLTRISVSSESSLEEMVRKLEVESENYPDLMLTIKPDNSIKITKRNAPAVIGGFIPTFVGNIKYSGVKTTLSGYFRFHLLALGLFFGFIGSSIVNITRIFSESQSSSIMELLDNQQFTFELQFSTFCLLIAIFAWLGGRPFRQRMFALLKCVE